MSGAVDDARPEWLLSELAHAGAENVDAAHVARYDDKENANAAAEVALLQQRGHEHSTVVDMGAGTGQFALAVAAVCGSVTAVDVSPQMLHRLRINAARACAINLRIVEEGFLTYHHHGAPVDFVYSRWALHHLGDFWKAMALARIRSMLRPGGLFRLLDIVYSFPPDQIEDRIERWRSTKPVRAGPGDWVRADIDDHVRDEHSTFTWLLEPMLEHSGFAVEEAVYSPDGFSAEYIARAI